jgi:hypothetical protein
MGTPDAMRVTFTDMGSSRPAMYAAVDSPSTLVPVARMISRKVFLFHPIHQFRNLDIIGADAIHGRKDPPRIWYRPLKGTGFFDGCHVGRLLHHADHAIFTGGIIAYPAQDIVTEAKAPEHSRNFFSGPRCFWQAAGHPHPVAVECASPAVRQFSEPMPGSRARLSDQGFD